MRENSKNSEDKKPSSNSCKEEEEMATVEKPKSNVELLELHPSVLEQAPLLTVRDGVVILDPKNPLHREWMEE
jgi:hypothetical protein